MLELTPEIYKEHIAQKLALLPDSPGCYLHKNAQGEVIYVGKAVSLKNRVRQYFQSPKNHSPKVAAMVGHIADFEYIMVDSEAEALTLESNLIKQYRPRYNILLKDDKHFPYVRMDLNTPFPRAQIVHQIAKNDGARYFGPYLSKYAVREAIEAVRDNFPLRTCKKDIGKAIARGERPCLNYHIGKCLAPCSGQVTRQEYMEVVKQVCAFLSGKTEEVAQRLKEQMLEASEELNFERAAMLRDRISAIELISEKQKAIAVGGEERDIFAFHRQEGDAVVYALLMRGGKVIGAQHFEMIATDESPGEVMNSFLKQYYGSGAQIPREVIVREMPTDEAALEEWLCSLRGKKTQILCPQRGDKKKLAEMAYKNAVEYIEKTQSTRRRQWERTEGALRDLTGALGLEALPERIEAFDISHTMGTDPVASMVVFEDGKPNNKQYRRFRIKAQTQNDDYASMKEVLQRRLERGIRERAEGKNDGFAHLPDLMLIDGGKGQLQMALEVMEELGLNIDAIGLAERLEEVYMPGEPAPLMIPTGSPALHLLQRVRDEAHRFAITYHRSLRQKSALFSTLDEIPGIGPKRRRALFEAFVSLDAIKNASLEELRGAKGMDKNSARAVYDYFHRETAPGERPSQNAGPNDLQEN